MVADTNGHNNTKYSCDALVSDLPTSRYGDLGVCVCVGGGGGGRGVTYVFLWQGCVAGKSKPPPHPYSYNGQAETKNLFI